MDRLGKARQRPSKRRRGSSLLMLVLLAAAGLCGARQADQEGLMAPAAGLDEVSAAHWGSRGGGAAPRNTPRSTRSRSTL